MSKSLINDLHAGISRRDWYAIETAAMRLRDEVEKTTRILAGTDIGSLPNDYPLSKLAQDLKDELVKANRDMDMYRVHGDRKSEQVIALQQSDRRLRDALRKISEKAEDNLPMRTPGSMVHLAEVALNGGSDVGSTPSLHEGERG